MIKYYANTRLMYPEPGETGGGETNANATNDNSALTLDFSSIEENTEGGEKQEEQTTEQTEGGEEAAEFALVLDEALGVSSAEAEILTRHAKELGVAPAVASKFINSAVADMQKNARATAEKNSAEMVKELRSSWGGKFDARLGAAKSLLVRAAVKAGYKQEDAAMFSSAHLVRLMDAVNQMMGGEDKPGHRSAPAKPALTGRALANDMLNNPENPAYKILRNLGDYKPDERIPVIKRYNEAMGCPGLIPER